MKYFDLFEDLIEYVCMCNVDMTESTDLENIYNELQKRFKAIDNHLQYDKKSISNILKNLFNQNKTKEKEKILNYTKEAIVAWIDQLLTDKNTMWENRLQSKYYKAVRSGDNFYTYLNYLLEAKPDIVKRQSIQIFYILICLGFIGNQDHYKRIESYKNDCFKHVSNQNEYSQDQLKRIHIPHSSY